ncbi:secretory carrier-associated membrane protein 2-like [Daphnia pulicaria]|uniref:secretory carrier-associated membrane protein 2-like n=1 Tax=Daphnia pulicaria TaxID=35523 RepID=UPI001EEB11D9|nr:secretory carrier-associated membrane protein 2-like [Daphnia pulicaria]
MSGFDQNPFAEPAVFNPFADPSVQQAAGNNAARAQQGLEEYNPFDGSNQTTRVSMERVGGANPPPTIQAAPVISPGPQQQAAMSNADFQRRQEELEKKAQELQRREEELKNNVPFNSQRNNWPPLPDKFCVQPCFYQDINVEIPLEFQKIVRMLYYIWMLHTLMYLLNVLGCLALFIQVGSGAMFGLSILYCILFTPASYLCWFRPVYKAFRSDSSFNFMVFFVIYFGQLIATVIQAIGIPNLGTCGFITGLSTIGGRTSGGDLAVGILVLLIGLGFGVVALGDFLLLVRVSRLYRSTGASFSKAQAEFTSGVMRNEHVRGAAADVVGSAVRAQMSNPSGGTGPRF